MFKIRRPASAGMTLGERGEMAAWYFLTAQGYELVEKNFRCRLGEIDVIAKRGTTLAFIEIKTRRHDHLGAPEEAVDSRKQKKIAAVAQYYLKDRGLTETRASFDVVAVSWKDEGGHDFKLIQDAFELETYV